MGSRELVTADKPTVVSKLCPDLIMVEDSQGNRCLPNPPCTNESNGCEIFGEANNLLNQFIASKTGPWAWGR